MSAATTVLLLTVGAILAAFGTLMFAAVWSTAPDRHDLTAARRTATAGRWAVALGLLALVTGGHPIGGALLAAVTLAVAAAVASLLTKAPLGHLAYAYPRGLPGSPG